MDKEISKMTAIDKGASESTTTESHEKPGKIIIGNSKVGCIMKRIVKKCDNSSCHFMLNYLESKCRLPQLTNIYFCGRDQEISKLESLFFKENNKTIVICGLPGFGKSELVKQFAHHCLSKGLISKTFWMTSERLYRIYIDFLWDDICSGCQNEPYLFIIDENTVRYKRYFPLRLLKFNNSIVLMTSNVRNCRYVNDAALDIETLYSCNCRYYTGQQRGILELNRLSTESAIEIFKSILGSKYKEEDSAFYKELASVVENVPLGLKILAEEMKDLGSNMSDIQKYDDAIKQYKNDIMNKTIPRSVDKHYRRTIYFKLKSSLDNMKSVNEDFLLNLLYICSYLNPEFVYLEDLFLLIPNVAYIQRTTPHKICIKKVFVDFLFVNYKSEEKKFIEIYRLTQNFLRYNLKENEQYDLQNEVYTSCLQYIFEEVNDLKYNMHHIKSILDYAEENVTTVVEFYCNHVQNTKIIENIFENLAKYSCIQCLREIIKKCDNVPIVLSNRNLFLAAKYDHIEILGFMLHNMIYLYEELKTSTTVCEFFYNHVQNKKVTENIFEGLIKYSFIHCLKEIIEKYGKGTKQEFLSNRNLLHLAAKYDQVEILKLFLDYIDINETNSQNETILHVLARKWDIKQLDILFKLDPNLAIKNNVGNVPLFEFVNRPNLPRNIYWNFVLYKFQFNAIDITNKNEETLLHIAAANYHDVLVKLLITKYNMNVNDKDAQGRTPFDVLINTFSSPTFHNIEINRGMATAELLTGLQNAK